MSYKTDESAFGRTARIFLCSLCLLAGVGFGLALMVEPDPRGYGTHQQFGLPPCTFQIMFGTPCPSCGGTTSFAHFVRGEWLQSLQTNAAAFAGALTGTLLIPWTALCCWRNRWVGVRRPSLILFVVLAAITLIAVLQWSVRVLGH